MKTLIIGYGNPYRRDDGVAFHVLSRIALQLGRRPLEMEEDGQDDLGQDVDLICLRQLVPELSQTLVNYDLVLFLDAHTGAFPEEVRLVPVQPRYTVAAFTHHMSPSMLLAIAQAFSPVLPSAHLISVRGYDFDLGTELSDATDELAKLAVERIMVLIADSQSTNTRSAVSSPDS